MTHSEPLGIFGVDYQDISGYDTIIIWNFDITSFNPVASTYIKQAVALGKKLITVDCSDMEIEKFASLKLKNISEIEDVIGGKTMLIPHPQLDTSVIGKDLNIDIHIVNAKRSLTNKSIPINKIAFDLGFDEATNFTKFFKKRTQFTPRKFRQLL